VVVLSEFKHAGEYQENYRIPNVSEFIKGFKYEVYSPGYWEDSIEDFAGWYNYEFDIGNCFRDLDDIEKKKKNGNIRVSLKSE